MIQVSKTDFLKMLELGLLDQKDKQWTVTSRKRPSSRKKHYVDRDTWAQYLSIKDKNSADIKVNIEPRDYSKPVEIVKMKLF